MTGLTVKTLRFYHEEGLLPPAHIDADNGYRFYTENQLATARTIAFLRKLDVPVSEIKTWLQNRNPADLRALLQKQKDELRSQQQHLRSILRQLDDFLQSENEVEKMTQATSEILIREIDSLLVAGIRQTGKYSDCGPEFGKIAKALGRYLCGKPLMLIYDDEYKEENADFEACIPVKQRKAVPGIEIRELPAVRCLTLVHQGPYDQLCHSYSKLLRHAKEHGMRLNLPSREVYLKGPGMIFKGNPKSYLTEIQLPIQD